MSDLRTMLLAMSVALAAAALSAGTASAQSIELVEESTGAHCSPVTLVGTQVSGGCEGNAASDAPVAMEAFGSLVSACDLAFGGHMDEEGNGYVDDIVLTGTDCTTPPCMSGGVPIPWPIELSEPSPGMIEGEAAFCVQSALLGTINCHVSSIGFTFTEHSKHESWNAVPCEGALGFLHLTGSGQTDDLDAELIHP